MPELPEVETVRRGLAPAMMNVQIDRVEQRRLDLRFPLPPNFSARLSGQTIRDLRRRAKYLIAEMSNCESLVMHLGMSGSFRVDTHKPGLFHHRRQHAAAHDHIVFHLSTGMRITYNDPRRFGFMMLIPTPELNTHPYFAKLGVEPLSKDLDANFLAQAFQSKKTSIKSALLDQYLIAGLGNIYVCEALFEARLSPLAVAGDLVLITGAPSKKLMRLPPAIKDVLQRALLAGGSSLRDHRQTNGALGYFQHHFKVYDREGSACRRSACSGIISRIRQAGRSTFYCPRCQK